ncbi:unnamed protein product [Symbiodinium sp. CCMP2456]|nr:unnamed protein product [Symbiodinium sp. CCMP2456]
MWKKLPGIHELSTALQSAQLAIGGDPVAARAKLTEYIDASILGSAVASGVQACRGNWREAERLGRGSGDVLGGVVESVGEGRSHYSKGIACCGRSLRCVARDDPAGGNAVWTELYRSDSVLGCMAVALYERCRGGDWHQHMEQSGRAWQEAQPGVEKVCLVAGVLFRALSLEGLGKTAAVAVATSPLFEALDLPMTSAALRRLAAAAGYY